MSLRVSLRLVVGLLAVGCRAYTPSTKTESDPPLRWSGEGAGPLVVDAVGGLRAAAFPDDGLVVAQQGDELPVALPIGEAPSLLALHRGELLVSLRAGRALARLRFDGERLVEVDRAPVGAEPVGLAVRADGERIYVAQSTAQQVWELDGDLGLLRIFEVGGNPEGLALHPSGETLYVSAVVGGLSVLDLALDAPIAVPLVLPDVYDFPKRVTGPAAVSPDGLTLAVPALWQDVMRPSNHSDEEAMARDPAEKYAEIGLGLTPNNPGVVVFSVDARGQPSGPGEALYAVGYGQTEAAEAPRILRSYLSSVAWSPDGERLLAAMEGSRTVVALDPWTRGAGPTGFVSSPMTLVGVGQEGLVGLVVGDEDVWTLASLGRSLTTLPRAPIEAALAANTGAPLFLGEVQRLAEPTGSALVERGRLLFHTAVSPVMSTPASGLSCSTCHTGGRTSGINTMERDGIPRQVPSFAGPVSPTAPFTWNNGIASIPDEILITSQIRLGGRGITEEDLAAVTAYIDAIPDADTPEKGSTAPDVMRGKAIFERPEVGCATCHRGPRLTDNATHDLYDLPGVNTPTLVGLDATAPYLHDGRAPDLAAVLMTTRIGQMGDTSMLDAAEEADLIAYLRSL